MTYIINNIYDTYANRPPAGIKGRQFFQSDGGLSWFDNGTVWCPVFPSGVVGVQPPLAASFTNFNVGSNTLTDDHGSLLLKGTNNGNSSNQVMNGFYIAADGQATDYVEYAIQAEQPPSALNTAGAGTPLASSNQFAQAGVLAYESSSSKGIATTLTWSGDASERGSVGMVGVETYSNVLTPTQTNN